MKTVRYLLKGGSPNWIAKTGKVKTERVCGCGKRGVRDGVFALLEP